MSTADNEWFHDLVSAVAYSLAQPYGTNQVLGPPYNDLSQFILRQHAQMPDFLRVPILTASLLFDAMGLFRNGTWFHVQAPARRQAQLKSWKDSSLAFQRDLVRYFESLATFALLSRPGETGRLEVPLPNRNISTKTPHWSDRIIATPSRELDAELVVLGSGPGGAITACRLAEAGRDVLLVEEGPFFPLDACAPFSAVEMLEKYRNGGQTVALGRNRISYVEGCCVGGGSEINSGLYHRTPPEMLERWRSEFGVEHLTEQELLPYFETCERDLSVSHLPGPAPAAALKLQLGASRLGWKSLEVPRWFHYPDSTGQIPGAGKRQTMTETYLPRFVNAGGRLLPRARALRLRQEHGSRWCVDLEHKTAGRVSARAGTVFVCAGAVQSAALLRRSGIKNHVGNSLRLHPTVKMAATFKETVNAPDLGVPAHQIKEFAPKLTFGCSISSPPYVALSLLEYPEVARDTSHLWQNTVVYYVMLATESHGSVRSLPGYRDPLVRFALTGEDRRALGDGLRKLATCLFESGATALYQGVRHSPVLRSAACVNELPESLPQGQTSLMTVHLFSTCPMGENKNKCVTDSFGRVHGFKTLFVNDASLLCTAPGVNPQGTIMALAHRNVLHYLAARVP